ncbi:MAG TPA: tyrosinase family protein [Streptosporangiaceae bacterium]
MTVSSSVPIAAAASGQPLSKTNLAVLRYRKSVTALTADEITTLRTGISDMLGLSDDRGYGYWAGIHGLPLPISCTHGSPLFLPWHRAYLYYVEQYLLDVMPAGTAVSLPWWDWSTQAGIPASYADDTLPDGAANPLASAPVTGIPDRQWTEENVPQVDQTFRTPGPTGPGQGSEGLPSAAEVADVMALEDFDDFTPQLEDLHNRVHVWVGGTMSEIPVAAFDPVFWAHHTMIDRLWAIWQQRHPGAGVGSVPLDFPLGPFPTLNVGQTLNINALGYQYAAASSSAAPGT